MTPNVRVFATEEGASAADARLGENGFTQRVLLLPSKVSGREAEAVQEVIASGHLPRQNERFATRNLQAGRGVVAVRAPFGAGEMALDLLERGGDTVENEVLTNYRFNDPSPLSDALGLPTLVPFVSSAGLLRSDWTLSSIFGMGLLSGKAAPLSSLFGMGTLTKSNTERRSSFGIPLLSRNAAPLSSLFGLGTLTKSNTDRNSSFGLPLLSGGPAPLSNLLGMRALSGERRDDPS